MIIRMCFDLEPAEKVNKTIFKKINSLTTPVYTCKPNAPWILAIYAILLLVFFALSSLLPSFLIVTGYVMLFGLPVYTGIWQKSIFSARSRDENKLTISSDSITWNNERMAIEELQNLNLYVFAIDKSRNHEPVPNGRGKNSTKCGDKNKLSFIWKNKAYDFTFFLAGPNHYNVFVNIVNDWELAGISFDARFAFEDSYIRKEMTFCDR